MTPHGDASAQPGVSGSLADGSPGAPQGGFTGSADSPPPPIAGSAGGPEAQGAAAAPYAHGPGGDEAPTAMLAPVPAAEPGTPAYGIPVAPVPPAEQTVRLRAVPPRWPDDRPAKRQRSRLPLLAAAGAAVAVGAVGLALVMFTGSEKGDAALVDPKPSALVTESAPADPSEAPTGPSASTSASPPPSPSASASRSVSASPSASRSASPSPTPSAGASRSPSPTPPPRPAKPVTLRPGDSGAEVEKLQRLLAEQDLYRGRFDGRYGRGVERAVADFQMEQGVFEDEFGVYGPATRRALEG
ncbi:peptidoglycan-binding protein [Streptomyces sp. NPDC031705]|uniref:peptidoglycan-binding protein n=1 Tax=Streptomyces sp. NPDC031705 TaxID=3155729 RepID=UPI0033D3918C